MKKVLGIAVIFIALYIFGSLFRVSLLGAILGSPICFIIAWVGFLIFKDDDK